MDSDAPLNVPSFGVCPPLRCFARIGNPPSSVCGELASWKRPGSTWLGDAFFCDEHRVESDVPITGAHVVRRVHIEAAVYLAGTATGAAQCQAEAVARLEAAVVAAGGLLEVSAAHSTIGQYPAPAVLRAPNASGTRPA